MSKFAVVACLVACTLAFALGLSGVPGPWVASAMQWAIESGWIALDGQTAELAAGALR